MNETQTHWGRLTYTSSNFLADLKQVELVIIIDIS